eukprot:6226388-Amphidinium_carterae.2
MTPCRGQAKVDIPPKHAQQREARHSHQSGEGGDCCHVCRTHQLWIAFIALTGTASQLCCVPYFSMGTDTLCAQALLSHDCIQPIPTPVLPTAT